ncbi:MAG: fatty acid desaturase [Gammaproteobacteria bacterium]|nr:fatty acid desaturase [Gammaproteobacteria bacterium]
MLNGLLDMSFSGYVLYTLVLTHVTIAAVTIFLHRAQAHRAVELHPVISHFFRFWLWLTTGMVTRQWVAVHRKHHARCESVDDPHSPQVLGLRRVLWQGAELYRAEALNRETLARYGKGTPDDWLERHVYARNGIGITLMLTIDLALLGPGGLSVWAVQMLWIPFWAAGVINGVGHYFGYRNYQSPDASRNIVPLGLLIGGEELHNNHHAYPASAKLSSRPWELDIGWLYIRLLALLGLARVKVVAPPPARRTRAGLDLDAACAIVAARLQVLAGYGREVMVRVYRDELRRARDRHLKRMLKPARPLLLLEESVLDGERRHHLELVLSHSQALQTAYQFRRRLQGIWQQSASGGPEAMLTALQEWCRQAEASGVAALSEFARRLGGYRLRQGT